MATNQIPNWVSESNSPYQSKLQSFYQNGSITSSNREELNGIRQALDQNNVPYSFDEQNQKLTMNR